MITLFLFIILIYLWFTLHYWCKLIEKFKILYNIYYEEQKSKKNLGSQISRWNDWNRKENDKDGFLQFFFIFIFNENLNLQNGVTYIYKILLSKSATFYQKRFKKKTINFEEWSNTFYQRNFIIQRIYYKVFIDEVSYNGAKSNRESKNEFSFGVSYSRHAKNQDNLIERDFLVRFRELEEEGGSYSFHPKYTRPLFYEETWSFASLLN